VHHPCITGIKSEFGEGRRTPGALGCNGLVERTLRKALVPHGQLRQTVAYTGRAMQTTHRLDAHLYTGFATRAQPASGGGKDARHIELPEEVAGSAYASEHRDRGSVEREVDEDLVTSGVRLSQSSKSGQTSAGLSSGMRRPIVAETRARSARQFESVSNS
jgi:hypothetical protein